MSHRFLGLNILFFRYGPPSLNGIIIFLDLEAKDQNHLHCPQANEMKLKLLPILEREIVADIRKRACKRLIFVNYFVVSII